MLYQPTSHLVAEREANVKETMNSTYVRANGIRVNGKAIKELREVSGLSQSQVADQSGLSAKKISDLERGHSTNLQLDYIQPLAVTLSCDTDEIILDPEPIGGRLLSKAVRRLREQHGLKQWEVAEGIGISTAAYAHFEARHTRTPFKVLINLRDFFLTRNIIHGELAFHDLVDGIGVGFKEEEYRWVSYKNTCGIWGLLALKNPNTEKVSLMSRIRGMLLRAFEFRKDL